MKASDFCVCYQVADSWAKYLLPPLSRNLRAGLSTKLPEGRPSNISEELKTQKERESCTYLTVNY